MKKLVLKKGGAISRDAADENVSVRVRPISV